jgi:hypothetical protein
MLSLICEVLRASTLDEVSTLNFFLLEGKNE